MPRRRLILLACLLTPPVACNLSPGTLSRSLPPELERVWEREDASWILAASHFYSAQRRCNPVRVVNVRLYVVPRREEYRPGGEVPGEAILAFTACSALDDHRAYRIPHADHWRLEPEPEGWVPLAPAAPLTVTYGAPLAAPGRKAAQLRFDEDERPTLGGFRLEALDEPLLASVLAGAGYAQEEPCGLESELEVRSWLLRSERRCMAPSDCEPDSLYLSVLDCRAPFRHDVFRMPGYRHWARPIADGFNETSGDRDDPGSRPEPRSAAREVVLEWWGGVPTLHPSDERWWDWTPFETFLTPNGARLVRKE